MIAGKKKEKGLCVMDEKLLTNSNKNENNIKYLKRGFLSWSLKSVLKSIKEKNYKINITLIN